ncbi:hypothetical protein F5Y16DRAFT_365952 [Xylariaceae sp. FL0255]|nr:hypothetical protein F5Y16DRAFT_365952 [Xylariaceae sp. FL0255]
MAEALSVAASGIAVAQIAAQVGSSIIKLKKLWDELQEVPSTIADLLEEINCLGALLSQAEQSFNQVDLPPMLWDNSATNASTAYCRKALDALTNLIDDLSLQLSRGGKRRVKVTSVKILLKKDQIKTLERKLQRAVQLLSFAQQSYLVALTTLQPDIIMQKFAILTASHSHQSSMAPSLSPKDEALPDKCEACHADGTTAKSIEQVEPRAKVTKATSTQRLSSQRNIARTFSFGVPSWTVWYTWEIQCSRSYGNWTFNIRQWRLRPSDSRVFEIAKRGTPRELQQLFDDGLASPFDKLIDYHENLLHCAAFYSNEPMIRYLLRIGLDPSERTTMGQTPVMLFDHGFLDKSATSDHVVSPICPEIINGHEDFYLPVLLPAGNSIDAYYGPLEIKQTSCSCSVALYSLKAYQTLTKLECPQHEKSSLFSRFRSLRRAFIYTQVTEPEVLSRMLEPDWSEDFGQLCRTSTSSFSLLHTFASLFGISYAFSLIGQPRNPIMRQWVDLMKQTILHSNDIHFIESTSHSSRIRSWRGFNSLGLAVSTPLTTAILSIFWDYRDGRDPDGFLKVWLAIVQSAGYDLQEYGRRENELLHCTGFRYKRWLYGQITVEWSSKILRGYVYGPNPQDWKILWTCTENTYFLDFWKLVEDPPVLIPGGWLDSDDESHSEDDSDDDKTSYRETWERLSPWTEFLDDPKTTTLLK